MHSVHTKLRVIISYCHDVVLVGNSAMYNEVHFIVSVYLSLSLQYNKVFEYARSVCAVPFDTAEALLDGYCLMMEFQCIVQKKKNRVSPLPLISLEDCIKLSILQYSVNNCAIACFIQQQVYKVSQEKSRYSFQVNRC